jgi:hypothetical protein
MVCEVNFPTTFRESLWVPSSVVMSKSQIIKMTENGEVSVQQHTFTVWNEIVLCVS